MNFLSGILAGIISAFSYVLGVDNFSLDTISITIVVAQLCFVLFAYLSIVFLLKSLEKDQFWPWNWGIKKLFVNYGKSGERRKGKDRRVRHEIRTAENERRGRFSAERRTLNIA